MEIDDAALAKAHPAVGDLPALLEELQRRDRITIGTERALYAAALLYRLAASGIAIDRPEIAAAWLAPSYAPAPASAICWHSG